MQPEMRICSLPAARMTMAERQATRRRAGATSIMN